MSDVVIKQTPANAPKVDPKDVGPGGEDLSPIDPDRDRVKSPNADHAVGFHGVGPFHRGDRINVAKDLPDTDADRLKVLVDLGALSPIKAAKDAGK